MTATVAVLAARSAGETRAAATPETVAKLVKRGAAVRVEAGAGLGAGIDDEAYREAGASPIAGDDVAEGASVALCVEPPEPDRLAGAVPGALLLGLLDPTGRRDRIDAYAAAGLDAVACEFLPRISRAQSMDVLSSQANLAGYKAVIDAAAAYGRAFPMMMTAAGTVSAARVFVMGVGVAGLQAIATARRLGAQVSATDVRSATREQIRSLGAKPIFVETVEGVAGEGRGGYAGEVSEEYRRAQAELVSDHIARQDIVVTTAQIPGRPAPRLVTGTQLATMRPGSVLFDLAVAQGGNVEGSRADEAVKRHGVTILGYANVPARLAPEASALYARNLLNLLTAFWNDEAGGPVLPEDDEIVLGARVTHGGRVVGDRLSGTAP